MLALCAARSARALPHERLAPGIRLYRRLRFGAGLREYRLFLPSCLIGSVMTKAVRTEAFSVSHGTHRSADLIPALAGELRRLDANSALVQEADAVMLLHGLGYSVIADHVDGDAALELVSELMDALQEHAGEGFYFGAHEGDGSDFGFWPISDAD